MSVEFHLLTLTFTDSLTDPTPSSLSFVLLTLVDLKALVKMTAISRKTSLEHQRWSSGYQFGIMQFCLHSEISVGAVLKQVDYHECRND